MDATPSHAPGQLEPGLTTVAMRKHLQKRAASESNLERVAELVALARQMAAVSPYQLRHGLAYHLWKQATPVHIQ